MPISVSTSLSLPPYDAYCSHIVLDVECVQSTYVCSVKCPSKAPGSGVPPWIALLNSQGIPINTTPCPFHLAGLHRAPRRIKAAINLHCLRTWWLLRLLRLFLKHAAMQYRSVWLVQSLVVRPTVMQSELSWTCFT